MSSVGDPTTVVLVTAAYPSDSVQEVTFVGPELGQLVRVFDRVIVAPAVRGSVSCPLPMGEIEVDWGLAAAIHPRSMRQRVQWLAMALADPWFSADVARHPTLLARPVKLRRLAFCVVAARRTGIWIEGLFHSGRCAPGATVVLTFWLNHLTAGAGLARAGVPEMRLVARAHGADVYAERYSPPWIPLHGRAVAAADWVFAVSEAGRSHLAARYPRCRSRIEAAPLGTLDPGFTAQPSKDGTFRLLSCSSLLPLKRVDLLISGLAELARSRPDMRLQWDHIGDGDLRCQLERLAGEKLGTSIGWRFHGRLDPHQVMAFYRDQPIDAFVSTSLSEGRPVSIMEAQSCAVPVIATAVGGVPEMVTSDDGILLSPRPDPSEVAAAIAAAADEPGIAAKRAASRHRWEASHDATKVGLEFAHHLRNLLRSTGEV